MRIVQIAPVINPGSGVAGVAYQLEREFKARGVTTERFTLIEAGYRGRTVAAQGPIRQRMETLRRVVWFSTVGTIRARRYLAQRPDAIALCHNDVMVGDVYVNHGLLRVAMKARGNYAWRMMRNPMHLFTSGRDFARYASRVHRVVVNLTEGERVLLRRLYPRLKPRAVVIPNGVDTDRFRPPTPEEREQMRGHLAIQPDDTLAVFVGHEFERKGLRITLEALQRTPGVVLAVVGGSSSMIESAQADAAALGVLDQTRFVGTLSDPTPVLAAADVFVLPSAYEANALVVLEALSCGLPVLASRVGFAPDIVEDGRNGYLIARDAHDLAARLNELAGTDLSPWREHARATAERFAWPRIAASYLDLVAEIVATKAHP